MSKESIFKNSSFVVNLLFWGVMLIYLLICFVFKLFPVNWNVLTILMIYDFFATLNLTKLRIFNNLVISLTFVIIFYLIYNTFKMNDIYEIIKGVIHIFFYIYIELLLIKYAKGNTASYKNLFWFLIILLLILLVLSCINNFYLNATVLIVNALSQLLYILLIILYYLKIEKNININFKKRN